MLGASGALTLVTVAGLAAGLGREWLLVHNWGAGARTDAFLVALFLPEAVRMMLGGGDSSARIIPFIAAYGLDVDEFVRSPFDFKTFNEFFYRALKPAARPIAAGERVAVVCPSARILPSRTIGNIAPAFCSVIATRPPMTSVSTAPLYGMCAISMPAMPLSNSQALSTAALPSAVLILPPASHSAICVSVSVLP